MYGLFLERRIEDINVVHVSRQMAGDLPIQFGDGPAAFIPRFHSITRDDQIARYSVKAIIRTFAPEKAPACGKRHALRKRKPNGRLEPDRVVGPENLSAARISPALKERVEGLQIWIVRVAV